MQGGEADREEAHGGKGNGEKIGRQGHSGLFTYLSIKTDYNKRWSAQDLISKEV